MRKNRGQAAIEFVMIAILALGIIITGLYKYGNNLANLFGGSNPEKRFNSARTVRFENPQDIASNIDVSIDGTPIKPPVETVIEAGLASNTYVQTSGSAARMAEMSKIVSAYVDELKALADSAGSDPQRTNFKNALDAYKNAVENGGNTGFLDKMALLADSDLLDQKLLMLQLAIDLNSAVVTSNIDATFSIYKATVPAGNRKSIMETFVGDLLGFGGYLDYFLDPYLYVEFLQKEKNGTQAQDNALLAAMTAALGAMTQEEKLNKAGLIRVYYGGGYSQSSPSAYNSERLCNTFSGVMVSEKQCEIPVP